MPSSHLRRSICPFDAYADDAYPLLFFASPGLTDRVHGISIARMAGLPDSVCSLAANKSQKLEDDDNARQLMRKEKQARTLLSLLAREDVSDARPAKILMLARRIS